MTRLTRVCRAVGAGIAVVTASLAMTGVAHAEPAPPNLDSAPGIAVPAGNQVFLVGKVSTGVQIYKCTATGWTFDHPEATLVGDNDKEIIKHFAGPTWQAKDGSTATKDPATPNKAATPNATAIPWLLIKTTAAAGPSGDRLAHTTFIQRVNTTGGLAPAAADCTAATVNTTKGVPYTADYYFCRATGKLNSKPGA
jgi:Protein of unknown function (DUF3455)